MNKNDLKAIENILLRLIKLNIMTKNKTSEYFYGRLEMNILIELIEDIDDNLKKISKKLKQKYNSIDWKIIEKERYSDEVFGNCMKLDKAWQLASTLYGQLYSSFVAILEAELGEYYHLLCEDKQKEILKAKAEKNNP